MECRSRASREDLGKSSVVVEQGFGWAVDVPSVLGSV